MHQLLTFLTVIVVSLVTASGVPHSLNWYEYNPQGRAYRTQGPAGLNFHEINFLDANTAQITGPLGWTRTQTFENRHGDRRQTQLEERRSDDLTDPPWTQSMDYDANGFPAAVTDFRGVLTEYDHNARGLEVSRTEAVGEPEVRTINTDWHPDYRLPTTITETGRTQTFSYTPSGQLETYTVTDTTGLSGDSRTWAWSYTDGSNGLPTGLLTSLDGPRADVSDLTTVTYYLTDALDGRHRRGDLHTLSNALGHTTTVNEYDPHGRPTRITDPNGTVSE